MKTVKSLLIGSCVSALISVNAFGQIISKSESFDSEITARYNGWVELGSRDNGMDYGYSAGTAYAGGSTGEAGGQIGRNQIRSMYADVFGAYLTLDDAFSASGRVAVAYTTGNAATLVGHSDHALVGLNRDLRDTIGILVTPATGANNLLQAVVGLADSSIAETVWSGIDVSATTSYSWSYSWNPDGGTNGNGALTVNVTDGINTSNVVITLTAAQRATGGSYDSFGLTTRCLTASSAFSQTYVDDVQYSALPACVLVSPDTFMTVPGQTNQPITVTVPPAYNASQDFQLTVTSSDPTVATPLGAVGGVLTLNFPAGGANTGVFFVNGVGAGTASLVLSNSNGVCISPDSINVTVGESVPTIAKSETFDTATSARANGWGEWFSRENGQDFGFSSSTNAGGLAGEAGGFVKRDLTRAAYADIFSGQLSLNDVLHASGTIVVTNDTGANAGPIIGHVDSSKIGQSSEANQIGLECVLSGGAPSYYARLTLANKTGYEVAVLHPGVVGQVYYWDYTYDPTAGPQGNGALVVNVTDGTSGFTNSTEIDLSLADRQIGASFDSFGMYSRSLSAQTAGTFAFMDGVSYTAVKATPDSTPPTVLSVTPYLSLLDVQVQYSERFDPATAQDPANYQIGSGGLTVTNVTLINLTTVLLQISSKETPGSSYDLTISSVQDAVGNTMVTTNLTFTAPNLVVVAEYDAGTSNNPAMAPDPASPEGGRWFLDGTTNDVMTVGGVSPDPGYDFNAWNVNDSGSGVAGYRMAFPQASLDFAQTNGWRLKVRCRLVTDYGSASDVGFIYGNPATQRYIVYLKQSGSDLQAVLIGGTQITLTAGGIGAEDYHTYEIDFEPSTELASFYFDGKVIFSGWQGYPPVAFNDGTYFGAGSSASKGDMNYNQVEFSVANAAPPWSQPARSARRWLPAGA